MTSEGFSPLFSMVVPPAMTGEKMVRKESFWAEHLGEQVINPALSIRDDGLLEGGMSSGSRDAEGYLASQRTLVEQGRLTSMLWSARCCSTGSRRTHRGSGFHGVRQFRRPSITPDHRMHRVVPNIDRGVSFHGPTPGAHGRRVRGEQRHGCPHSQPEQRRFFRSLQQAPSSRSRTGKSLGRSSRRACLATSPNPSTVRFTWARMYVGKVPTPRAACTYRTCC